MALVRQPRPWTLEGDFDPAYDDVERARCRRLLTDPRLALHFRRRFPMRFGRDYETMIRALGAVWDCPDDGTAKIEDGAYPFGLTMTRFSGSFDGNYHRVAGTFGGMWTITEAGSATNGGTGPWSTK